MIDYSAACRVKEGHTGGGLALHGDGWGYG